MANEDALVAQLGSRSQSRKATKAETNYRPESEEGQECGGCIHFIKEAGTSDGSCEEVAGAIFHEYVCDLYEDDGGDSQDTEQDGKGD